jgi:gamma-glutamylcyclotransferase (GGCT)/AIG2-like uncharacterized protein YtfP
MSLPFLATYGTLMRSFGRIESFGLGEQLAFRSQCQFRGEMYDLGSFPGAVPGSTLLHGELFRLKTTSVWSVLDEYEGYTPGQEEASLFVRRKVLLHQPLRPAWVYWYNGQPADSPRVPSGDWEAYTRDR